MTIPDIQEKVRKIQKGLTEGMDDLMSSKITLEAISLHQAKYEKLHDELKNVSAAYGTLMVHFQEILSIK